MDAFGTKAVVGTAVASANSIFATWQVLQLKELTGTWGLLPSVAALAAKLMGVISSQLQ